MNNWSLVDSYWLKHHKIASFIHLTNFAVALQHILNFVFQTAVFEDKIGKDRNGDVLTIMKNTKTNKKNTWNMDQKHSL